MNPDIQHISAKNLFAQAAVTTEVKSQIVVAIPWTSRSDAQRAADILMRRAGLAATCLLIEDDQNLGPAAVVNRAFEKTEARLFCYLAQDVFPGRNWLLQAVSAVKRTKAGLLAFNDGKWAGRMASFGMVDRQWAAGIYGGKTLFYPGYRQHFGDVELTLIARQQQRYAYDANAVMMEVDYAKESKGIHEPDRELFAERKLTGFDGRVSNTELLGMFG